MINQENYDPIKLSVLQRRPKKWVFPMALKPDLKKKKEKWKLNSSLLENENSTNEWYCKALEVGLPLKKAAGGLWIDWFCCRWGMFGRGRCELKGAYGRGARGGGPYVWSRSICMGIVGVERGIHISQLGWILMSPLWSNKWMIVLSRPLSLILIFPLVFTWQASLLHMIRLLKSSIWLQTTQKDH